MGQATIGRATSELALRHSRSHRRSAAAFDVRVLPPAVSSLVLPF
jgi:hypothetical protein